MDAATLRKRIAQILLEDIEKAQYPSPTMMDRFEATLRSQNDLSDYAEVLVKKIEATRYPSIPLLDRLERLLGQLEEIERWRRAEEARGNGRGEPAALSR